MAKYNKLKVFNDPIYGFIRIPNDLIYALIEDPYFQRLRRISQMGMSFMVFPGAHHTRFHHALGCMDLMGKAIYSLRLKGVEITKDDENGLLCAILLHDIGHGPFSHTMEESIVEGVHHEHLSLLFMETLNTKFNGSLTTAIKIFKKEHPKKFLNQLVSSQLDIDRLDYLKRDSFYTGVAEGNINAERLVAMLNVIDDNLVVEEKGIYSVEKFLMARRFMYWQVYLHKTSLAAEQLLIRIFLRAKSLTKNGVELNCSLALKYFISNKTTMKNFTDETLHLFAQLDDVDVLSALKNWQNHNDYVLSTLCKMIIERKLPKVVMKKQPADVARIEEKKTAYSKLHNVSIDEASYFIFSGVVSNQTYNTHEPGITIFRKKGKSVDISKASDQLSQKVMTKSVTRHYFCYPKMKV